jgi:uncharacterized protein
VEMTLTDAGKQLSPVVLKKGVPVKWKIHTEEDKSCVSQVVVPKLGLDIPLKKGEQIIEFTPDQEGIITWSCSMGMTSGSFQVVDDKPKTK